VDAPLGHSDGSTLPTICSILPNLLNYGQMKTSRLVPITKLDDERRLFGGWAYVAMTKTGRQVVDQSGDVVDTAEAWEAMKDAFLQYALESRKGDLEHETFDVAKLVELFVSDEERWEQMGIPAGTLPKGVFVTFRALDTPGGDQLWDGVKSGRLHSLSIVGEGWREDLEDDTDAET
jgi:hypothetical protein